MTKKFTLMMLFLVLFGSASFSQTASLATVTASPGENIAVALNVTGFTGIGSITFRIQFDPSIMTLSGVMLPAGSPWLSQGSFWGVTGNTINFSGVWGSYTTFPDSKMFDLNFTYNGMTPSPLIFLGSCEVTQGITIIYPTYTNGSVSMAVVPAEARLIHATASTGGNVAIPIEYKNFSGTVGAVTQIIHYDPTKLNFISVTGVGNLASGTNFSADIITGIITITWSNIDGKVINSDIIPFSKFLLNFVYIGNTATNIDFVGGCIISTPAPVTNVLVTYYGNTISPGAASATAVLESITDAIEGQDFEVPLRLAGFPSGVLGGTQAFTLTIPYDSPRLSYLGIASPVPAGLIVSQASGILTLAWSNAAGPDINGIFLKLKFKYNGIGTANVAFGNGCVFNTFNAGVVGTVQVAYTNASITPAVAAADALLGFVQATAGENVNVPINFTGLPLMGAVLLKIAYDFNKLTFIDAQNTKVGTFVELDPYSHSISIIWDNSDGLDLNNKFLDLRFTYNGSGGDGGAAISFIDGCELTSLTPVAIVPANWHNGGVNVLFKISGTLKYNSDPNPQIPLVGFNVKLLTPADILVTSATTDATGYYEVWAANGSYKLDATSPVGYIWYADIDDVVAMFDYVGSIPLPYQNQLRVEAGDVNQNGDIDIDDVVDVFFRVGGELLPDYLAPDWVFEHPSFLVNNAAVPNKNFLGINSGNVLGTNPTPNP